MGRCGHLAPLEKIVAQKAARRHRPLRVMRQACTSGTYFYACMCMSRGSDQSSPSAHCVVRLAHPSREKVHACWEQWKQDGTLTAADQKLGSRPPGRTRARCLTLDCQLLRRTDGGNKNETPQGHQAILEKQARLVAVKGQERPRPLPRPELERAHMDLDGGTGT